MDQVALYIYLKGSRKYFAKLIISKKEQIDEFITLLNSGNKIVKFYDFIINVDNFNYAIIER